MPTFLNHKGQFSIIAAALASMILIATVMITYSTIRNSPSYYEPKVLSAIDETNLAIKQVLGFTLGYYCSILQVTGNNTYAKDLTVDYFQSGLRYISQMHPDWGTSFKMQSDKGLNMTIDWFKKHSNSVGNISVSYDFTGLGIYGLTYKTSNRLDLYSQTSYFSGKACIRILRDQHEPIINLGKTAFRFYRYNSLNFTWDLVNPVEEPTAFANGTYLVDLPSGVDQSSYLVQVQDSRGIIVVSSSYNEYKLKLEWNSLQVEARYSVAGSTPTILGAPDGNFAVVVKGKTCEVQDYQLDTGKIEQVQFKIIYYGTVSGTLGWYYQLDSGPWTYIEDLPNGGSASSPLSRTYNATSLRATWSWNDLNNTSIQFRNNDAGQPDDAYVDAIYVMVHVRNSKIYSTLRNATLVVELLQDGTIRWLGQSLQAVSKTTPFPPLPIKTIHVNQTINSISREMPFQIEDWEAKYQIPVGLSSNASLFNNRKMLVFLVDKNVSEVTIWWDGRDTARQTSYAYTNRYFSGDNPASGLLTNGILTLRFGGGFTLNATLGSSSCLANFMRINNQGSVYGASPAYVVHHGIVRDVIHQEAEWSGGASNCPNVYAHIVLTLPAKSNYYTYQFRLMFTQSPQSRRITDLYLIQLQATVSQSKWGSDWIKTWTHNGTALGNPIVSNETGFFYNSTIWEHRWSEFIEANHGFGVMATTRGNTQLYVFDKIAGNKTGGTSITDSRNGALQTVTIRVKPVSLAPASFQYELDTIWYGATVLFDGGKSIYSDTGESAGLWMIVEYPPTLTFVPV